MDKSLDIAKKQLMHYADQLKKGGDFIDGLVLGALIATDRGKAENIINAFLNFSKLNDDEDDQGKLP
jgi:hypothetical protein